MALTGRILTSGGCFGCANSRLSSVIAQKQMCAKYRTLPAGFCNKSSNEEPEAASTDDSRLYSDSDHLFELFWIQAAGQGHTS